MLSNQSGYSSGTTTGSSTGSFTASSPFTSPIPAPRRPADAVPRRRGRGRAVAEVTPLGSLTQREHRTRAVCLGCGSHHVTRLSLCLTDGTPVEFTSCHRCEHRAWEHAGLPLSVEAVLDRTRKE
jgi:hypothetical protein